MQKTTVILLAFLCLGNTRTVPRGSCDNLPIHIFAEDLGIDSLPQEFNRARQQKISTNVALQKLHRGIKVSLNNAQGEKFNATLKGFWFHDLAYLSDLPSASTELLRLRNYLKKIYSTDKRLNLSEDDMSWVTWEDTYFYQHVAWVYLENSENEILATVKVYYFDYPKVYAKQQALDNEKQIALPMERKTHVLHLAKNEFQRTFLYPLWSVPENSALRKDLVKELNLAPKLLAGAPGGYYEIPSRKLNASQIEMAMRVHQKHQVGEVSRFTRNPDLVPSGVDVMAPLAYGLATILRSQDVRLVKMEGFTPVHARHYSKLFNRSGEIPGADANGFSHAIFEATPADFERLSHSEPRSFSILQE